MPNSFEQNFLVWIFVRADEEKRFEKFEIFGADEKQEKILFELFSRQSSQRFVESSRRSGDDRVVEQIDFPVGENFLGKTFDEFFFEETSQKIRTAEKKFDDPISTDVQLSAMLVFFVDFVTNFLETTIDRFVEETFQRFRIDQQIAIGNFRQNFFARRRIQIVDHQTRPTVERKLSARFVQQISLQMKNQPNRSIFVRRSDVFDEIFQAEDFIVFTVKIDPNQKDATFNVRREEKFLHFVRQFRFVLENAQLDFFDLFFDFFQRFEDLRETVDQQMFAGRLRQVFFLNRRKRKISVRFVEFS